MRISNEYMANNLIKNLNENREKLNEYNEQLSTGKQFDLPSDDPTGVATSMNLDSKIEQNKQNIRNIDEGIGWSESTDSALGQMTEVVQRARELASRGANGSLNEADRQAVADEIHQLRENVVEIANTTYNDRYIFSGQKTQIKPYKGINDFSAHPSGDGYNGDNGDINRKISSQSSLKINQSGENFEDILDHLNSLENDLRNDDAKSISNNRIDELDEDLDTILQMRSENGARQKRMQLTKNKLEEDKIKFQKLLSQNEDVDIAKTIMDLKMSENVYRAALSSGGRIIQPSLVDFIK
ncbi:flagellar hook-associated protein FlgL [Halanaerobacter jeridensis]|uniref:Flagellar hook-associated protein 3 FlgL n=1 Tax=Halanaerobacter jeridensis TaxID=706427 RepID=A0A938XPS4_9FIRM|nr:flagellar hook-associated protein 3 FlgL [Halanaerobacter jeridensis]